MTLYEVHYKKYSYDDETKMVRVVASGFGKALEKGNSFVRKNWANRVVSITELYPSVEVAK